MRTWQESRRVEGGKERGDGWVGGVLADELTRPLLLRRLEAIVTTVF